MNNRNIFMFLVGSLLTYLAIIAVRIFLFEAHVGDFNTHPITGVLITPVVVSVAACIGGGILYALKRFAEFSPFAVGSIAFGVWCTLPMIILIDKSLWFVPIVTAPLVPFVLGARWRV